MEKRMMTIKFRSMAVMGTTVIAVDEAGFMWTCEDIKQPAPKWNQVQHPKKELKDQPHRGPSIATPLTQKLPLIKANVDAAASPKASS